MAEQKCRAMHIRSGCEWDLFFCCHLCNIGLNHCNQIWFGVAWNRYSVPCLTHTTFFAVVLFCLLPIFATPCFCFTFFFAAYSVFLHHLVHDLLNDFRSFSFRKWNLVNFERQKCRAIFWIAWACVIAREEKNRRSYDTIQRLMVSIVSNSHERKNCTNRATRFSVRVSLDSATSRRIDGLSFFIEINACCAHVQ